jgi:hypothetical protein
MTFDIVIPRRGKINRGQEVVTITCEEELLKSIWRKQMENEKTIVSFLDWIKKKCIEDNNALFGEKSDAAELLELSNGHSFPYKVGVPENGILPFFGERVKSSRGSGNESRHRDTRKWR